MSERIAIVTGASRGLGLETSKELAARGMHVVLAARDVASCERAAAALRDEGHAASAIALDVADAGSVTSAARAVAGTHPRVHVLVNNAGISMRGFDARVAKETLATNFFGALRVTDAFLPMLADGARVVMVSSGLGELSSIPSEKLQRALAAPDLDRGALVELMRDFVDSVARGDHRARGWPSSAYAVSKAGMNALARVLARELAPRGIVVNAVCPGWVRTDMGGSGAPRSVREGAKGIVWAATLPPGGASGGFFRDGEAVPF